MELFIWEGANESVIHQQKVPLYTKSVGNVLQLDCWGASYFPTYNGIDPLDKIECIDGKWSLPDDMGPIQCASVTCSWPPIPASGKEIWNKCIEEDRACESSKLGFQINKMRSWQNISSVNA